MVRINVCEDDETRVSTDVQSYGKFVRFGDVGALIDILKWRELICIKDEFYF